MISRTTQHTRPRWRTDITPTKLRDLQVCPLKAHFRHDLGLTDPGHEGREVGGIVHHCLTRIARPRLTQELPGDQAVHPDELTRALEEEGGSPRAVERAAEILQQVAGDLDFSHTIAVDEPWQLDLGRDEATGRRIVAGGRFDRVDRLADGSIRLYDYRTGRPRGRQDLVTDDQVGLRLAAARSVWPEAHRLDAAVWWVDRDLLVTIPWTEREDRFARLRARIGYRQLNRRDRTARVGEHCADCPYRARCQAYQEEQRRLEAAPVVRTERWNDARWLLEERERLKQVAVLAETGRRELDEAIRARIGQERELRAGDLRAKVITRRMRGWSVEAIPALAVALDRDPIRLLEEVGQVSTGKLKLLLREAPEEARRVARSHATHDATTYVEVREVAPFTAASTVSGEIQRG